MIERFLYLHIMMEASSKNCSLFKGIVHCLFILIFNRQVKIMHIHTASRGSFFRKKIFVKLGKTFKKKLFYIYMVQSLWFYQESSKDIRNQIREVLNQVDVIITLSQKWKEDIESITNNRNVKVIYNAIDSQKFNLSNLDNQNILFMGRVGTRKGIYDLVDIMPQVVSKFPHVKLHIAGDGDLPALKRKIKDLNINNSICIHGWINHNQKLNC